MNRIARSPLRYFGGKWQVAAEIISHFPPHSVYVEPFGGGASVLLQKPRLSGKKGIEVYNDLDGDVVNFFRVLRERPDDLIRAIYLTPFAKEEYELSQKSMTDLDDLERARRFYTRSWQGRGGPTRTWRAGWRRVKVNSIGTGQVAPHRFATLDHLWAVVERLRGVQIEKGNAFEVIQRYDSEKTLFYCDPPYPAATRSNRWRRNGYLHELSNDDHRELAAVLHNVQGMVIISSYPGDLYDELYGDWRRVCFSSLNDHSTPVQECIWLSPSITTKALPLLAFVNWTQEVSKCN